MKTTRFPLEISISKIEGFSSIPPFFAWAGSDSIWGGARAAGAHFDQLVFVECRRPRSSPAHKVRLAQPRTERGVWQKKTRVSAFWHAGVDISGRQRRHSNCGGAEVCPQPKGAATERLRPGRSWTDYCYLLNRRFVISQPCIACIGVFWNLNNFHILISSHLMV